MIFVIILSFWFVIVCLVWLNHKTLFLYRFYYFLYRIIYIQFKHNISYRVPTEENFFIKRNAYLTDRETPKHQRLDIYFTAFVEQDKEGKIRQNYMPYFKMMYTRFLFKAIEQEQSENAFYLPKLIYILFIYMVYLGSSWYVFDALYHKWCFNYYLLFIFFILLALVTLFTLKTFLYTLLFKPTDIWKKWTTRLGERPEINIENISHKFSFTFYYNNDSYKENDLGIGMLSYNLLGIDKDIKKHISEYMLLFLASLTIPVYLSIQNISVSAYYQNSENNEVNYVKNRK